jgi:hypothetical protein
LELTSDGVSQEEIEMAERNANLSQAQQKFLMDRLSKAVQAKRPSWRRDTEFLAAHPKPKSVLGAEKTAERAGKIIGEWDKKLEGIFKARVDAVDEAYNKAKDSVLFGTAIAARAAVEKFESMK